MDWWANTYPYFSIRSNTWYHTVQKVKRERGYSCNICTPLSHQSMITMTWVEYQQSTPWFLQLFPKKQYSKLCRKWSQVGTCPHVTFHQISCEICRNVVGRKKHAKHQNVPTEPRSPDTLIWRSQRTCSVGIYLPQEEWQVVVTVLKGPQELSLPNSQHPGQARSPYGGYLATCLEMGLLAAPWICDLH